MTFDSSLRVAALVATLGGMSYLATQPPPCKTPEYDVLKARAVEKASGPFLSVTHFDADGNGYGVRYRGFDSTEEFLAKNPNCCEDVTQKTLLEGFPPETVKKYNFVTSISVMATWPPITRGFTESFVSKHIYHVNRCGKFINL